jgi:hypothetical protein
MIIKSIFTALIIFMLYAVCLVFFNTHSASQNQNQDNLVKAQSYMFKKNVPENVIVGTSLSCYIQADSLNEFYNLAFNGFSIYDGLQIVLKGSQFPKNVFIESNFFLINRTESFYNQLFDFYPYYTSKYIRALRIENQPIGKLVNLTNSIGDNIVVKHNFFMKQLKEKLVLELNLDKKNTEQKNKLFNKVVFDYAKSFAILPTNRLLHEKLKELEFLVTILKSKGVNVYFFEMPIHYKLMNTKRVLYLRNKLSTFFYKKVHFIDLDSSKYITSDGVHLNYEESKNYSHFYKQQVLKLHL